MPPLKAEALHRLAREQLGPALADLGFSRTPKASAASWSRPEDGRWLVIWLQPSRSNDQYTPGFTFTVELLLGPEPVIGGRGFRARLPTLLTDPQREELRQMENRAISKLPPPDSAFARLLPPETRASWLDGWKPRTTPYADGMDVWFRHADEADARDLMAFFQRVLPLAITRFLVQAAEREGERG